MSRRRALAAGSVKKAYALVRYAKQTPTRKDSAESLLASDAKIGDKRVSEQSAAAIDRATVALAETRPPGRPAAARTVTREVRRWLELRGAKEPRVEPSRNGERVLVELLLPDARRVIREDRPKR